MAGSKGRLIITLRLMPRHNIIARKGRSSTSEGEFTESLVVTTATTHSSRKTQLWTSRRTPSSSALDTASTSTSRASYTAREPCWLVSCTSA
jgi:hypothetical protein